MRILACAGTKVPPATIGFRPESLDFRRGIRVGKLEEHERITPILKLALVLPGNSEPRASIAPHVCYKFADSNMTKFTLG